MNNTGVVDSGTVSSLKYNVSSTVKLGGASTISTIDFNGTNGVLNAEALITGDVDNKVAGGNSTLNFITAAGGVTVAIGNTKTLHEVNLL